MRYKLLGRSGLRVSELCLGTMTFGDDWGWDGVRFAVQRFARENSLAISHRHDKWELRREA